MTQYGTRFVVGSPSHLKAVHGISPIAGKLTFRFGGAATPATVTINDGPELFIEDKGDHWCVAGLQRWGMHVALTGRKEESK